MFSLTRGTNSKQHISCQFYLFGSIRKKMYHKSSCYGLFEAEHTKRDKNCVLTHKSKTSSPVLFIWDSPSRQCTGTSWLSELNPAASEHQHLLYDLSAYSTGLQHAFSQMGVQAGILWTASFFIFHLLPHKLFIWAGPIAHFWYPLFWRPTVFVRIVFRRVKKKIIIMVKSTPTIKPCTSVTALVATSCL